MIRGRSWGRRRRVSAPPLFDAATPSQGNGTRSWSHTVGAGGSKTILAALCHLNRNAGTPTPVTCDGVAMTFVGTAAAPSGEGFISVFAASGQAPGAHAIVMTTGESYTIGLSVSYSGVASIGAPSVTSGSSTAPTTGAIAVDPNETLVSAMFLKNTPSTVTNGISRLNVNHSSGYNNARMMEGSGSSPQTNRVTQAGNTYAIVSVKLAA